MKKQLSVVIIFAVLFLCIFIFSVVLTESINFKDIKNDTSYSNQIVREGTVKIPAPSEQAIEYQKNKTTVWVVRLLLSFLIPFMFLFSGLSARISRLARKISRRFIVEVAVFFILYSLIDYLLNLPMDLYAGFIRPHAYGLSNQAFGKWFEDSVKNVLISSATGAAFIWFPYLMIKKSPRLWWLYTGLVSIPMLFFVSYISPLYIDPLFNRFEPVQNSELDIKIHGLLHRTTLGDCNVFQVNKSEDTKEMNAYMSGSFGSKRIVLWDTTVKNLTEREILCVVAHEMGHYLMGHIWKSIILGGLLIVFTLYLVNKSALWMISQSEGRFGFRKLYESASLPLLILLINVFMFISAPATNAYSRSMEKEADRFEIELTRDNTASAMAMVKLAGQSLALSSPGLVYKWWNYDHPTFKDRIEFENTYKPWEERKPLVYQKYIVK